MSIIASIQERICETIGHESIEIINELKLDCIEISQFTTNINIEIAKFTNLEILTIN